MAIDQNSVLNRTALMASAADEQPSSKKVKLLCSFGGRILPRPGDGALRYVGGQTRIISVPISVSFADLTLKLADACGSSGAVAVKYQLPNEDLDSLVSVSCPEDLENMMEEYDKLDGTAKLRTFLFTPSSDSTGALPAFHLDDTGQSYIDALNWIADDHISMQRKESVESSASYTQNSDSNIDGSNEGTSPALLSPTIVESNVPAQTQNSAWTEPPPALPYPHQVQYINPQPLGMAGGPPTINLVPFTPHPYQPAAKITMNPLLAHASGFTPMQPRVDPYMGENQYGGRVVPPLSQLPPLPPAYLQAQNVEQYGLNQMLLPQGQVLRLEDCFMCQKAPPQMVVGTPVDNVIESKVTMLAATSQLGAHGFPQMAQYAAERPIHQKIDNLDHVGVFLPPESILNNLPQSYHEDPLQQQQQQPRQNLGQEVITKLLDIDAGFVRNESLQQQSQPLIGDTVHEFANDHARPIDVRMEGLRVSPTENSWFNEQWKSVAKPNLGSPVGLEPGNLEPSSSPFVAENDYNLGPQTGGYDVFSDRVFANSGIVPEGNFVKPINQLPPTSIDVAHLQNLQSGMSAYPCSIDPACNDRTINKIPAMNWTEGASHFHTEDMLNYGAGNILCPSSNTTRPAGHVEPSQEPVPSDSSLFSNEDPWNVLGVTHLLPPEPGRIVRPVKGSAEEHIKQELQAVAEGVAASVLQPSALPAPVFITHETEEHNAEFDKGVEIIVANAIADQNIEDTKPKFLDKMNPGLQITEDIGHLQIIKNSDLEELRELGSGTFGTVYHGKWRGSDVAIKRINDRCFAGKPSEQERMRADFWNEACKLADLHHPNVVAFYGVVLDGPGGSVATVTEYMVNGSLRNALQSNEKTFDRRKRLLIATDVAFGMEYLHGKNIVHFDLKSDNLLVNLRDPQRPICKVGDLGLSKVKCQTLISGGVRGTLPWMAPELLNGSSSLVSEKVDVFSFGIVMWELLTGEEPYADLHYGAIIGGIVSNTLRPLVPESCDPEWRLLMENCWSAEPSERPSFTEIASRLRSVAASLSQRGPNQRPQTAVR